VELTDTHCHLYMQTFDADLSAVVERAAAAGVTRVLVPGLDKSTSQRAIRLAAAYRSIYSAVGVHPTELAGLDETALAEIRELLSAQKVVALGEIGLDYYWVKDLEARRHQLAALQKQLELAGTANLPAVLHLREEDDAEDGAAARDLLAVLREWTSDLSARSSSLRGRAGVLHSFSGTPDTATQAIELGFYIGVTAPITYPNASRRRALVAGLPLERLLIETDSPFLAPQPQRGQRNEPANVTHIADRIASIQSRTPAQVAESTTSNAARLFAWGEPD
jgi:TatD DNase family protein